MHEFTVWAPYASRVAVKLGDAMHPMNGPDDKGWCSARVESAGPGMDYAFLVDDDPTPYPDPRGLWQPNGVHGPSRIYDHGSFVWTDERWQGPPLSGAVMYEMHIGTFYFRGYVRCGDRQA